MKSIVIATARLFCTTPLCAQERVTLASDWFINRYRTLAGKLIRPQWDVS